MEQPHTCIWFKIASGRERGRVATERDRRSQGRSTWSYANEQPITLAPDRVSIPYTSGLQGEGVVPSIVATASASQTALVGYGDQSCSQQCRLLGCLWISQARLIGLYMHASKWGELHCWILATRKVCPSAKRRDQHKSPNAQYSHIHEENN